MNRTALRGEKRSFFLGLELRLRTEFRTLEKRVMKDTPMDVISATDARAKLYRLIDEAATAHKPILITGQRNNAVLVSEEDWNAIQETLHLLSVPGMRESILQGGKEDVSECKPFEDIEW
jgi:prevent-host-death family protein